ncbi:Hypothetical predicted protein [Olea europaea subsp. europaea]|uniref:Retrotransposon gag domain-containing protein n=1 Tax=Olea europaea subsp. europaea TaxID=158383 RepID=A0A8S0UNC6_OLEEU|nr:Hypothetical predicted protein [Olea europaea subsp. europaea]
MRDRLQLYLGGNAGSWCFYRRLRIGSTCLLEDRAKVHWDALNWEMVKEELKDAFLPADYEVCLREQLELTQSTEDVITFFHKKMHICRQLRCSSPEAVRAVSKTLRPEYRRYLGSQQISRTGELLRRLKTADLSISQDVTTSRVHKLVKENEELRSELAAWKAKALGLGKEERRREGNRSDRIKHCFRCREVPDLFEREGYAANRCRDWGRPEFCTEARPSPANEGSRNLRDDIVVKMKGWWIRLLGTSNNPTATGVMHRFAERPIRVCIPQTGAGRSSCRVAVGHTPGLAPGVAPGLTPGLAPGTAGIPRALPRGLYRVIPRGLGTGTGYDPARPAGIKPRRVDESQSVQHWQS